MFKKYFDELNVECFDFRNGFKRSDVHIFEKLISLSINIFELIFHQNKKKCKHNLILIEISKNDSDKTIDSVIYKNHYALIKKLYFFSRDQHENII